MKSKCIFKKIFFFFKAVQNQMRDVQGKIERIERSYRPAAQRRAGGGGMGGDGEGDEGEDDEEEEYEFDRDEDLELQLTHLKKELRNLATKAQNFANKWAFPAYPPRFGTGVSNSASASSTSLDQDALAIGGGGRGSGGNSVKAKWTNSNTPATSTSASTTAAASTKYNDPAREFLRVLGGFLRLDTKLQEQVQQLFAEALKWIRVDDPLLAREMALQPSYIPLVGGTRI